jgi:hypothetical protein
MIIPNNINVNPQLFDKLIKQLRLRLELNLTWLNNAFGSAYKISEPNKKNELSYPAIYVGKGEYLSMLPDESFGNYSFVEFEDPQLYDKTVPGKHILSAKCAIIFWFNFDTIFDDDLIYHIEDVKKQILDVIAKPGLLTDGRLTVVKIITKPEGIFNKYKVSQINSQFLLYPYAGLRFECEVSIFDKCTILIGD